MIYSTEDTTNNTSVGKRTGHGPKVLLKFYSIQSYSAISNYFHDISYNQIRQKQLDVTL